VLCWVVWRGGAAARAEPGNTASTQHAHTHAQAALQRGAGDLPAAIDSLRGYLDVFSNDREGWEELAECYLEVRVACVPRRPAGLLAAGVSCTARGG
jgi:hypothetical protein